MKDEEMYVAEKPRVLASAADYADRERLKEILSGEYALEFALNSLVALETMRRRSTYVAFLLDMDDQEMNSFSVLSAMLREENLRHIPVIAITADFRMEAKCLRLGASDVILKPFRDPEAFLVRLLKAVQLAESAHLVRHTQHDPLTGLYNEEYFYCYIEKLDSRNPEMDMDAILVDIDRFHLVNEVYGQEVGNRVLMALGGELMHISVEEEGLACRREGDVFYLYLPHREKFNGLMDRLYDAVSQKHGIWANVRLKLAVYPSVDKNLSPRMRFSRAKSAWEMVRRSYSHHIAIYNKALYDQNVFSQQLLNSVDEALEGGQFKVYYQPKYDITANPPVLAGAEALARWFHPQFGLISPSVFIPLFEEGELIQKLDRYVWEQAAAQIARWKESYGLSIPISVNVSRVDLRYADPLRVIPALVQKYGISASLLHLEVTESAYFDDAEELVKKVNALRELGFQIEMDDFGSGYSSLSTLSYLPIDVLKLDMGFIRNAFGNEKNIHIIRLMMGIKHFLHVPVIAEGVENEEQLKLLKEMDCDMVQGYYFSPPVPPETFEELLKT
ncbi:MAG: putative bifunctional diguanylate cyclase/phosphodiesterase [bacterium]